MGDLHLGLLGVGSDDGIEGEHVRVRGQLEGAASGQEAAAFGIEEDEVVGEVSGGRDDGLDVQRVEGLAGQEVSLSNAVLQEVAKVVEVP